MGKLREMTEESRERIKAICEEANKVAAENKSKAHDSIFDFFKAIERSHKYHAYVVLGLGVFCAIGIFTTVNFLAGLFH